MDASRCGDVAQGVASRKLYMRAVDCLTDASTVVRSKRTQNKCLSEGQAFVTLGCWVCQIASPLHFDRRLASRRLVEIKQLNE